MKFRSATDFWFVVWLVVCVLVVFAFAEPGIHAHSPGRAIGGVVLGTFLVGPLFVMAYLRWFRKN